MSEGDNNDIAFDLYLPFVCEGENIDTVTYSVDKGALYVSNHVDNNPVIKSEKSKLKYDTSCGMAYTKEDQELYRKELEKEEKKHKGEDSFSYDGDIENELLKHYESKYYSSITLAYNNQHPDGSLIEYVGSSLELNKADQSFLKAHNNELFNFKDTDASYKKEKVCIDKLIGGDVIHCTVRFKNGEEKSQDIVIGTKITKLSETNSSDFEKLPEEVKPQKDFKDVFITFSVK